MIRAMIGAMNLRTAFAGLGVAALLVACSGGGDGISGTGCDGFCQTAAERVEVADIERILAQGIAEAQARGAAATIAVVDRVGNVLGVYRMAGADVGITVDSGRGVQGGLEQIGIIPDTLAAISKAITAAYLSSEGNAFTPRTANQIVQEHFNPGETNQPGGPLLGVQFSSLPCSDLNLRFTGQSAGAGPQRAPLGLSADAGGLPLYRNGAAIGGVGVIADGVYGADLNIRNLDSDLDELIAVAAQAGLAPPDDRRADRITVDGKTLRYSDAEPRDLMSRPADATVFSALPAGTGSLVAVPGYTEAVLRAGTAFGTPQSGIRPAGPAFAGLDAFVLVDNNGQERFAPRAGSDVGPLGADRLTEAEVTSVLRNALRTANRARAQIRRPLSSQVRVTISVVDTFGAVLGMVRTRDAPVFGVDVSLQKARASAFFSNAAAAEELLATPPAVYLGNSATSSIADYVDRSRMALSNVRLFGDGAIAFTPRAVGNLARPFFPDGLVAGGTGPLSKPFPEWSPFSTGLQLDLVNNAVLSHVVFVLGGGPDPAPGTCTELPITPNGVSRLGNGIQIFAGGSPIYRGDQLIGAVGISGDGIDQDDMIAFLGLFEAGVELGGAIGHAPQEMRADRINGAGGNLRYVQCPQSPFLDSGEQNVCQGK